MNVSTGVVGNPLTDNSWFDAAGNVIKQLPAGSSLFAKTAYDSLGRGGTRYSGYDLDETTYTEASSVTDDTILEQSEIIFDNGGNAIQSVARRRYHNAAATQTGPLQNPSTGREKGTGPFIVSLGAPANEAWIQGRGVWRLAASMLEIRMADREPHCVGSRLARRRTEDD